MPKERFTPVVSRHVYTPWQPAARPAEAYTLEVALPAHPGVESFTLLLSAGVEYGRPGLSGEVEPLPHAAASRILAVG